MKRLGLLTEGPSFFVSFENPLLCEGFQRASSYGQEKNPSRTMKSGLVNRLRTKGAPNG